MTQKGIELLKKLEGFSPDIYICAGGYRTIGYGHKLFDNEEYNSISEKEAENLLLRDILIIEKKVKKLIYVVLKDNELDALISFTFNAGAGSLQRSTLRMKLNRGEFQEAGDEFLKWCYAGGRKLKGLLRRRVIERQVFLYGIYI